MTNILEQYEDEITKVDGFEEHLTKKNYTARSIFLSEFGSASIEAVAVEPSGVGVYIQDRHDWDNEDHNRGIEMTSVIGVYHGGKSQEQKFQYRHPKDERFDRRENCFKRIEDVSVDGDTVAVRVASDYKIENLDFRNS